MNTPKFSEWSRLSSNLRQRRQQLGLSTKSLTDRIGYSPKDFFEMFEIPKKYPPLHDLPVIAKALEVDVEQFCKEWLAVLEPEVHRALFPDYRTEA